VTLSKALLVVALMAATDSASAETRPWPIPWDGFWRDEHADCRTAVRYQGAQTTSETLCNGLSATPLAIQGGWLVHMRCDDEGRVWTAPRVVLLDGDRMWVWFGPGGLGAMLLQRCDSSDEY
jgi:hypothetical protein